MVKTVAVKTVVVKTLVVKTVVVKTIVVKTATYPQSLRLERIEEKFLINDVEQETTSEQLDNLRDSSRTVLRNNYSHLMTIPYYHIAKLNADVCFQNLTLDLIANVCAFENFINIQFPHTNKYCTIEHATVRKH